MINKRMSALSYLFKLLHFKDVTKKFVVRQILRSYRKEQARKDRRRPISLSLLNKLFDQLRGVFFRDMRKIFLNWHFLWHSMGRKMITLNRIKESPTCPVRCLENFLKARPDKGLTFLIHEDGWAFSAFQFLAVLRNCLMNLGLNEKEYASHSFRIGAATQAKMWGLDPRAIKKLPGSMHSISMSTVTSTDHLHEHHSKKVCEYYSLPQCEVNVIKLLAKKVAMFAPKDYDNVKHCAQCAIKICNAITV
ncbi:hypothetical protein XELAEV_18021258mg [Xenopus laevis]|uniref:Tyr recombinase domain-containing protein n=1 Tax=Xenopus laevis TaxID=8355 RepID=A0A974D961_XENLA|nr:hypothetical protein XELAEV_18021258mg [Xenopus laevis]